MSGLKLFKTITGFMDALSDDHVGAYAAQSAYFIILSIFPFLILLISLIQFTPITQEDIYNIVRMFVPASTDSYVMDIIDEVYSRGALTISVSAIAALWSSGKGFMALSKGMDTIYKVSWRKNYIIRRLQGTLYTFIFILAIVLSLVVFVFGNTLHDTATKYFPFLTVVTSFIVNFRLIFAVAILVAVFLILYIFVPHRKIKAHRIFTLIPGAALAAVAWFVFSKGFSIYVEYSPRLTNMYGSLTTIIVTMLWLYFCMYIILIGAEVNAFFEEQINVFAIRRGEAKERKEALKEASKSTDTAFAKEEDYEKGKRADGIS